MTLALHERANAASEDFRAMVCSIKSTAEMLRGRFVVSAALRGGPTLPVLESNVLDRKFGEYWDRAKQRHWKKSLGGHPDYVSLLGSLSPAERQEVENRVTVAAWNAAKGPFLEALCLLADVVAHSSAGSLATINLFVPTGPIRVSENGRDLFIWSQPQLVGTRSGMRAVPDIVITTDSTIIDSNTIFAVRECKCHRKIQFDEVRKECGKAADLDVASYVIVSYYPVSHKKRVGAAGLGLRIELLALHAPLRDSYVTGKQNLVRDLAVRFRDADDSAEFRHARERGAALARVKERHR